MEVSGQLHAPTTLPRAKKPHTHWTGDWVGPEAGLDPMARRKIPAPAGNRTTVVLRAAGLYDQTANESY